VVEDEITIIIMILILLLRDMLLRVLLRISESVMVEVVERMVMGEQQRGTGVETHELVGSVME